MLDEFIHEPRVAYFSTEIALRNDIPTYAGGLGVLAGDTVRSAADLAGVWVCSPAIPCVRPRTWRCRWWR